MEAGHQRQAASETTQGGTHEQEAEDDAADKDPLAEREADVDCTIVRLSALRLDRVDVALFGGDNG